MEGPLDVIKSYLVSLGFTADQGQFNKVKQTLAALDKGVSDSAGGMSANFMKASGVVVSALASIGVATAGLMDKVAQADLSYQKFALRMYMSADFAKKFKISLDSLGESMEDIAYNPELRQRFQTLLGEAGGMETPGDAEGQLRYLRDVRFEFTRMRMEATYGAQWITYYLFRILSPMGDIRQTLKDFNDRIQQQMPIWTAKVAAFIQPFIQLGSTAWQGLKDIGNGLKLIWDNSPDAVRGMEMVAAAALLLAASGPIGRATIAIGLLTLALDDFYAWREGRPNVGGDVWGAITVGIDLAIGKFYQLGHALTGVLELWGLWAHGKWSEGAIKANDIMKQWKEDAAITDALVTKHVDARPRSQQRSGTYNGLYPSHVQAGQSEWLRNKQAIMMAESGGDPNAFNMNRNGSVDVGLFQINSVNVKALKEAGIINSSQDLFDPAKNEAAADWLAGKYGTSPWNSSKSRWGGGGTSVTVNTTVNVAGTNASAEEIARKSAEANSAMISRQIRDFTPVMR